MKFNLSWLKEYIDIDEQPSNLANLLTMAGVEVSECSPLGIGFENVVSAEILKIRKHPNADKLSVCQVSNGKAIYTVVCGASNIKEKDKVPLAMEGAQLPDGTVIRKSKIRGELSCGMLCSGSELKLTGDSQGIYILPKDAPLGRNLSEYLNLKDWKLELEITPNRGDLLGMIGVAREVGALTGRKVRLPEIFEDDGRKTDQSGDLKVEIADKDMCTRYAAAVIKGVKIGPSPDWIVRRLESAGIRSINNIVDVTNYVMLEWGQPLHAFDHSKIGGRRIVVRRAKPSEKIKTIDGQERVLNPDDLAICDISRPIAIAGIMGGFDSEINPSTKDIVVESAQFDPRAIRKTSRRLDLSSDSSYRFERGVDPVALRKALLRAVNLIEKTSGGKGEKAIIDVWPEEHKDSRMILKSSKVEKVLGVRIPPQKIKEILERLGFETKNYGDVDFEVTVPSFRQDVKKEIDLIEEVARIYGYHLIPTTLPQTLGEPEFFDIKRELMCDLKEFALGAGFMEMRNYSFISEKDNALFAGNQVLDGDFLKVLNPISPDQSVMRQSLIPSLLRNMSYHKARKIGDLKLFEQDRTFHVYNRQCQERNSLVMGMSGIDHLERWDDKGRLWDFFDVKGLFEEMSERFGLRGHSFNKGSSKRYMHPKISMDVVLKDRICATFGMCHPDILKHFDLDPVYLLEMSVDVFAEGIGSKTEYRPFSKFPSVERDISIIVGREFTHEEILKAMTGVKSDLVKKISLFDLYEGEQVPKGKKSLTYRVTYQSKDKTLTDDEVLKVHERIVSELSLNVKAELRK